MRFQQSQRNNLKEHFGNHVYYKLCRLTHDAFQQHCPAIILSTEELFADAARTLDALLTEGDFKAEKCMDLWSDTLSDYREKDGTNADAATTQAEVAMLFYAVMFGLQSVNHSFYRGKMQNALHLSIHQMWNRKGLKNCDAIERDIKAVNTLTDGMLEWMKSYFYSAESLTGEINAALHPKKTETSKNKAKNKECISYTLPYNCRNKNTRVQRINIVMKLMQSWGWIEEPEYADDFYQLFEGEPRNCNIKWIGKPLAILTELMKQLLNQTYMDKVTGLSVSSIVKNQFGKSRSGNSERLDIKIKEQIDMIVRILDYNKPLQPIPDYECEEADLKKSAMQAVFKKDLHITKDINSRYK